MTGMLASVRDCDEARAVLEAGIDVVDIKNPSLGALGALDTGTVREIVRQVGRARPCSATIGDLAPVPATVIRAVEDMAATGVDFVKVGLFPGTGQRDVVRGLAPAAAQGIRIVIVLFADHQPDWDLLDDIARCGCAGVMLDTAVKDGSGLRAHVDAEHLRHFVSRAHRLGLFAGLAGSLGLPDVEPLLALGPDYLGFRGALCVRSRRGESIDTGALAAVRAAIPGTTGVVIGISPRGQDRRPVVEAVPLQTAN